MNAQTNNNTGKSISELATQTGPTAIAQMGTSTAINGQLAIEAARAKAEIDQQITTAKTYPRNVSEVANRIHSLVMLDDQTAEECVYALPRGGKAIRGPSIRFAEIMASQWGNCRQGSRTVQIDKIDKMVIVEAVFHDLETNSATTKRISRRISDSKGKIYNDDMITMTANAAQSIALRNAILGGIPKAVWRGAFCSAEQIIAGDVKTLIERRDATIKAFAVWGVVPEQIAAYLEINSVEEIQLDDIITMRAVYTAIKDEERKVEDVFEPVKGIKSTKPKTPIDKQIDNRTNGNKAPDKKPEEKAPEEKKADKPADKSASETSSEPKGNASGKQPHEADNEVADNPSKEPATSQKTNNEGGKGEPSESQDPPFIVARNRGREAAENDLSPKAVPPEYRGDTDDSNKAKQAWTEGFEARTAELKTEQGQQQ